MRFLWTALLIAGITILYGCGSDSVGNSDFTVSPSSLAFGDVPVSTAKRLSVSVVNTSGSDQYPLPSIIGADAGAFSIVYQPTLIPDGAEDSVVVEFLPAQQRSYSAQLQIGSTTPVTIPLSGRGVDASNPYELSLRSDFVQQPPVLDGSGGDAAWASATELSVDLSQVQPGAPQNTYRARLKSVNDGTYVYMLIRVEDATRNDSPNQFVFAGGDPSSGTNWTLHTNGQDGIGVIFPITGDVYGDSPSQTFVKVGCNVACHQAQSLLNYESGGYPGHGAIDIWYWKAGTTNPQGYADDQVAVGSNGSVFRNERRPDVGADFAVPNFTQAVSGTPLSVAGGANNGWDADEHIWDPTSELFDPTDPNPATGFPWASGDIVPGWRLRTDSNPFSSRNNVEARGVYSAGGWTVELRRRLDTGGGTNPDDVTLARNTDVPFSLAYFDNTRKYAQFEYTALQQKPSPSHFGSNPRTMYLLIR